MTLGSATSKEYVVSQLGQAFKPAELTIQRGETVQILNDDGDLLHHVYLESDQFRFDSGDQSPGSRTKIDFPDSRQVHRALRHPPEDEADREREVIASIWTDQKCKGLRVQRRFCGKRCPTSMSR